jgi:hypothetical protein
MSYDAAKELARVKTYYEKDVLQKRFSALICGSVGAGKTYLLRTARFPVHIDSFDPGGSKCLKPWIDKGWIVVDTSFEHEDPFNPSVWAKWTKITEIRLQIGYYNIFGTYAIDSSTKFQDAAMNFIMLGAKGGSRAGESPQMRHDYTPTKVLMQNYFTKFMNLPCDFILTGHFKESEELLSVDKSTGVERKKTEFRYMTIGQAAVTIPLMFDEIYVLKVEGRERLLLLDEQGQYIARSRLKSNGKLNNEEPANIKELLKKIGLEWEDKARLNFEPVHEVEEQKSV